MQKGGHGGYQSGGGGGGYDGGGQQGGRAAAGAGPSRGYGASGGGGVQDGGDRPQSRGEHYYPAQRGAGVGRAAAGSSQGSQSESEQQELPPHVVASHPPAFEEYQSYAPDQRIVQEMKFPSPMPPATQLQRRDGLCSLYTLNVEPGRKAYRYDVDIQRLPMQRPNGTFDEGINLTKASDDGQRALHRNLCFDLITVAFNMTNRFGMQNGHELIYNCASTMFTSTPLRDFDMPEGQQLVIENGNVNNYVREHCGDVRFTVEIRRNQEVPELNLDDFEQYLCGKSVYKENRSLRTFFEMAISQHAINTEEFVPVGMGKFYEFPDEDNAPLSVGNGMQLRQGLAKGVKIIKNDESSRNGKPKAAVVLDTKVSAFFEPQKLVYTVLDMLPPSNNPNKEMNDFSPADWQEAERLVKDLRVKVNYRKIRTFELGKFTDKPIRNISIDVEMPDGRKERMTIPQLFEYKNQIKLRFTGLPGIMPNTPVKQGNKVEVFPLEVLTVMEDQRVPLWKSSPDLKDKLLKANSLFSGERMARIEDLATRLGLFHDQNLVLRAFGITVDQKSNRCVIGVRPLPKIRFGGNQTVDPDKFKGEWPRDASRLTYLKPSEVKNWLVLCSDRNMDICKRFVDNLMQMAQLKGMRLSNPEFLPFQSFQNDDRDWSDAFEKCKRENNEFVMLIDEKRKLTHGLLKLYEVFYKPLVTQHVTFEKARDVVQKGQRQTCENIVNKLNMKNFGLNYVPQIEGCAKKFGLESGNVLVIGLDVSHPDPMSGVEKRRLRLAMKEEGGQELDLRSLDPSVAGICANMAKNPHAFVGDYFYQESRSEQLDLEQLVSRTQWILRTLEKARPKHCRPPCIVVLRDGLSEGQFSASKLELDAIRTGCRRYDPNYKPKFILAVGTKRHFKKFFEDKSFKNGHQKIENLVPGSVIQEDKVRADLTEFYLQPHASKVGAGKPIEYSILENEVNASQDDLQSLLMSLSYSHQIVNIATSLPEPVYQAGELAKRGKNVFAAFKEFFRNEIPRRPLLSFLVDFHRLNEMLCYWENGTTEESNRFTA